MAEVGPGDVVYDLGCGDGRILVMAIRKFKADRAVGYELREDVYKTARAEVERLGLQDKIHVMNSNFSASDLSDASVITLYLTTAGNESLKSKMETEARPATRVISHDFKMAGWKITTEERFEGHSVYLYRIPDAYSARLSS